MAQGAGRRYFHPAAERDALIWKALHSPSAIAAARVASSVLNLVSAPLVARGLGAEGRGLVAAGLAALAILPIVVGFGLPLVVRRRALEEPDEALVRTARLLAAQLLVPSCIFAALFDQLLFSSQEPAARLIMAVGLALSPLIVVRNIDVSVLIVRQNYGGISLCYFLQPVLYVASVLVLWIFDCISVSSVLGANVGSSLASLILTSRLVRVSIRGERNVMWPMAWESGRIGGSQVAEVASSRLDQLVALPLIGASESGLYAIAVTISALPLVFSHALGAAIFSPIGRMSEPDRSRYASVAVRLSLAGGIVATAPIAMASPFLVPVIFGSDFAESVAATLVSLCASPLTMATYVAGALMVARGRGGVLAWIQVAGTAVDVLLVFVLGANFGALGFSICSSLSYALVCILCLLFGDFRWKSLVPRLRDPLMFCGLLTGHRRADSIL
ncbi:lipopolysaccharide biosynthesis protein [Pseudonocardia sp. RS010]|uniref:lipopolysaccharide biosynthesis protein n=1 Tax=Pseudonocardia sp. RS010 TaxID=3385979 RepID=UPI0039A39627